MRINTHSTIYRDESMFFYIAIISLLSVFFAYIYFVSISIADVVIRKEIDSQIATVGTTIGRLEANYIEMQHSVSNDIATHSGYVSVAHKVFIDKSSSDTLVMNQN